ncbi:MAG TPA: LytTR family DNA-binding domain-containing protein [Chitinophagaceae bacterium]|jgi:two-component system LytT family response regulator|nr:LytTR family DNA-binding domain-containing protein [Chitinophagaceae bacterium]
MIRTIIIDDENSAINVLSLLLKKTCKDDVEVVATTNSPAEGKSLIEQHKPDLVFLDIEMPGMTGIDLIRSIPNPNFHVVFVTAYDAYAIEAFELSAIDYLLKPIGADKVERVINKIKENIRKHHLRMNEQLHQLEKILKMHTNGNENKIGVGMADKIVFVNIPDILYCEAQGNYTNVILYDGKKIVASKTLGDFENQLVGKNFFRVHHSYLINMNRVKEFQRYEGGYVVMENNIKLEVSQRKRKDFLDAISSFVI